MRLKTSSSATFYGLMTKHSDKEHYRFKLRYLVSPVLTRFAVSCLHLLFEAYMTSRSCFTDSFCQECLGETSRMHDFAPKVSGQISTCIGFSRTGKCSVVATRDWLPTSWFLCLVCETEEALDRTVWRTRCGRGYGSFVQQTMWCVSDTMFLLIPVARIMTES